MGSNGSIFGSPDTVPKTVNTSDHLRSLLGNPSVDQLSHQRSIVGDLGAHYSLHGPPDAISAANNDADIIRAIYVCLYCSFRLDWTKFDPSFVRSLGIRPNSVSNKRPISHMGPDINRGTSATHVVSVIYGSV